MRLPTFPENLSTDDEAHCRAISWANEACESEVITLTQYETLTETVLVMRTMCARIDPRVTEYVMTMLAYARGGFV